MCRYPAILIKFVRMIGCGVYTTLKPTLWPFLQLSCCKFRVLNYRKNNVKSIITDQMFLLFSLHTEQLHHRKVRLTSNFLDASLNRGFTQLRRLSSA